MAEWAKKARTCESPAAKKSLFHAMPASNKRAIQDAVAAQEIAKKAKLEPSPYETLFRTVSDTKTLKLYGLEASLECLGQGYFMHTFAVAADTEIWPEVENTALLVKIYHGGKVGFNKDRLSTYTNRSLANYNKAIELQLPVSTIHNAETVLEDKYFLVERIPHAIEISQDLEQVHAFFKAAFANKVYFDLDPSNLRVRGNGTVTLIDFVEEDITFKTTPGSECISRITALLTAWATLGKTKAEGEEIVKTLTAGLEQYGFNPQYAKDALQTAFPQELVQLKA